MSDYFMQLIDRVTELERRMQSVIVEGVVTELQMEPYRVKVNYGTEDEPVISSWLPVAVMRSATASVWWPLEEGEAVTVHSPNGNLIRGRVYPASYSHDFAATSDNPDLLDVRFGDDGFLQYNRVDHTLTIDLPATALTKLISKGGIKFTGDLDVDGNINSTKNIHAAGEVSDHTRSMQADRDISNKHGHNVVNHSKAIKTEDW